MIIPYKKIIVHDGSFHADDVLCVALIKLINNSVEVVRTRNESILKKYNSDPNVLICDVGLGQLDHHQKIVKTRKDGRKMASCGLLYEKLIEENYLPLNERILKEIISIEHFDNGQILENEKESLISTLCQAQNLFWNEKGDTDKKFNETIDLVLPYIYNLFFPNVLTSKENNRILENIKNRILIRSIAKEKSILAAEKELNNYKISQINNIKYYVLESYLPMDIFLDKDADFVIYPNSSKTQIILQAVNTKEGSFDIRAAIPKQADNVLDFVHTNRFLGAKSYKNDEEKNSALQKMKWIIGFAKK